MKYNIKYKTMETAVADISIVTRNLENYGQRLGKVKTVIGSLPSLENLQGSINSRVITISNIVGASIRTGKCLDNVRVEYINAELRAKQFINGLSKKAVGAAAVGVVKVRSFAWDLIKKRALVRYNAGVKAVKAAKNVSSKIKGWIGPGGRYEGAWKAVTTTVKLITGAALLATSVATGNVLGAVYGANMLIGAGADMYNINRKEYDKVGKTNLLKTAAEINGQMYGVVIGAGVGYVVGGRDGARTGATIGKSVGSAVGTVAYTAGEIYAVASVGKTVIGKNTVSELTNPKSYKYAKEGIEFVDSVAKGETASWATGKIVGEAAKDYVKNDLEMPKGLDLYNEIVIKSGEKIAEESIKVASKP